MLAQRFDFVIIPKFDLIARSLIRAVVKYLIVFVYYNCIFVVVSYWFETHAEDGFGVGE